MNQRIDEVRSFREFGSRPMYDDGTLRAEVLFRLLSQHRVELTSGEFLDLGCGFGGVALYAASRGARVTAADADQYRLDIVNSRANDDCSLSSRLETALVDAAELPFPDAAFDQVLTIGVLEWVPLMSDRSGEPRRVQISALAEIARVLKPGGTYVFANKNRWAPQYFLREPHVKWPLVNHLPRPVAQVYSRFRYGQPYRTYSHSLDGWTSMLHEAGFSTMRSFLPVDNYVFPVDLWSTTGRHRSRHASWDAAATWISPEYLERSESRFPAAKHLYTSVMSMARIEKLLWPAFIIVAEK